MSSETANKPAPDDNVHLIVAEEAEVVIEHHPEDWIAFVLFWALAFIVFLQFFTRYILNDSLAWTEEIARYGLMWVVFIGGAMVTRRNSHIAVELLSNVMKPGPLRATLLAFVDVVKLAFLGLLAYVSVDDHRAHGHSAHDGVRPADELRLRGGELRLLPDADPAGHQRLAQRAGGLEPTRRRHPSSRGGLAPMHIMAFVFIVVLLTGVPVFIALAGASFIYTHFIAGLPDFVILHRMAGGIDSFPLLAVPFFILAGNLMNSAGITNRIYDFAVALAGWTRGGLAHVNIIGSVIFAGMSGTAIADAAGLGTIEIKAMQDHGYDTEFSVGVTAASSTLGPIIPPSLPFVIYGMMGNVSIGALFLGGVIPGAVMTIFMMAYVYYCARKYNMGRDQAFRWSTLGHTFIAALPALLTPAIIIGGMTFGWFTPTEAAIAACAWAMILGIFLYRTLSPKQFYKVTMDTIETTAGVLLIVAAASLFGWVLTTTRVTEYTTEALLQVTNNKYIILLLTNVVLLVVGCFLEPIASISILVPVLMPVIVKVGIDPVHFGVMMTLNLMIGLLHPPLGMVLFVLSRIAKLSLERTTMAILPWLIPLLCSLIAITLIPELTLWLPRVVGLIK